VQDYAGGEIEAWRWIRRSLFGIGGAGDSAKLAIEIDPDDGITIYAPWPTRVKGNDSC